MVFDEATEEWKPRHGYKRINGGIEDVPIVEVKAGQDPYADPWTEDRAAKKDRVKKNQKNQEANIKRSSKTPKEGSSSHQFAILMRYVVLDSTLSGIPIAIDSDRKHNKESVRRALEFVQHSTQSLGRCVYLSFNYRL
jgi:regulator of ribosome biosynthesis